ncbi:MAG: rRNA maturation RNase YbeY [Longimicrobiales bacterium]|nr:rRNA maturation RNase YbeY [Longimicrobiales bacterium]
MPDPSRDGVVITVNAEDVTPTVVEMIERGVRAALSNEGASQAEVSVTLLDDSGIEKMNATYLDRDRPTDVIAFSLGGPGDVLGDVYIGFAQAERQSAEHGEAIGIELLRLAIHGTLHVLGYDHPDGPERWDSSMFSLQERLLAEVLDAA